jgi:hypothetical protein
MRTLETKLFKYDELNEEGKERAREWLAEKLGGDWFEPSEYTEDLVERCQWHHGFNVSEGGRGKSRRPELYWNVGYGYEYVAFSAWVDVDGLKKTEAGDGTQTCVPEREELFRITDRLRDLGVEVTGFNVRTDNRGESCRVLDPELGLPDEYDDATGQLLVWVDAHVNDSCPMKAPALGGLDRENEPDFAPFLIGLDYWEDRGVDVSLPRQLYERWHPGKRQEAQERISEFESAAQAWTEAVCHELRDTLRAEVEYKTSDKDYLGDTLEGNEHWEFTVEGDFYG